MKFFTLAIGLVLALATAAPVAAFDFNGMSDAERAQFRAEVRAYLLENPEVLIEAINELKDRQAKADADNDAALVKANSQAIFNDGYSWVAGNPKGNLTLVEFMDYRCTYCRKAYGEVSDLVKSDGNIRFVVKEYPILGDQSTISARYAVAVMQADGPEAYAKAHDALITFRGEVNAESLTRLSQQMGWDAKDLLKRMDSPEVTKVLNDNLALGNALQVNGTPTFILSDQMVRGYMPLDAMQGLVAKLRSE